MPRTQASSANSKKSRDRIAPLPPPNVIRRPRLKFRAAKRADRSMHSLDQLSSVPTRSSIANIYTTEHAALIFIACKLLQRPRCISVVFATIGPIFRGIRSSLPSSSRSPFFLPSLSLSSFSFLRLPPPSPPLSRERERNERRKRNSRSSRDNVSRTCYFFRGKKKRTREWSGEASSRKVKSGLNMHVRYTAVPYVA